MSTLVHLPILDLRQLDASPDARADFLASLRDAARETGFFYLTGHGIDPELQQEVQQLSQAFFALPLAAKQQVAMIHSPHFRGYNRPGAELTRGQPDWREQFDIGADRPALPRAAGDPPWWRLQGPNQWPEALPT
ncbi:2-oxoglutarate and iron-dependent oxygenase domain-containing protein, partial [Aeromonas caviae]